MTELPKVYDPGTVEKRIYEMWQSHGCFKGVIDPDKKPFSIVMPPPNVTGQLHMGHALDSTLQDILTRYKRMQGYAALWLPGTDHAGIATQIKVEEELRVKEGLTRYDLGREKFLERVWEWKNKYGDRIVEQQKVLGASCDWDRSAFTMDSTRAKSVRETFCELYEKGLIYKGSRIINWCPKCRTALSDAEVEYKDMPGSFWHIRYPIEDSDEEFIIATTRPETMLGDSGVAVHPDDERYKHLVGKNAILPLVGRKLPIVADEYVELGFGTGAVKMTPCHDPNDYEVGLRHNLEQILCIDEDAKIINGGKYNGMDRYEARKAIVADLEEQGYLVKVEPYNHNVGCCYRCGTVVEPLTSPQWFVKMKPLAEAAIEVVKDGRIKFVPERFTKTYMNWMENVHDWCISRQLWWGHRIPAYYCDNCGEMVVAAEAPTVCPKCGKNHFTQDPDTLDTWFSSALWPFSTLGWPEKTPELDYFYPNDVLVTGYDIIFFWVIRMIFSGYEQMGKAPFKTVLFHGLVRDDQGRKMSKSLGNGIDPLEVIDKYGADALRLTLITGNAPGNDMRFYWERVENSRNFANKVWNASRFIMMNLDGFHDEKPEVSAFSTVDHWILSRINTVIREVTEAMDKFELGIAVQKVYDFIWDEFCDWYIELVKPRIYNKDAENAEAVASRNAALWTLKHVLSDALKLLHPYMPFITEEIFLSLHPEEESIMISSWPVYDEDRDDKKAEEEIRRVIELVRALRDARTKMNVPPSRKATLIIVSDNEDVRSTYSDLAAIYQNLAMAGEILVQADKSGVAEDAVSVVIADAICYMPLSDLVDLQQEKERLEKEKTRLEGEMKRSKGMLSNEKFLAKAPESKVNEEKEKMARYQQMLDDVTKRLAEMK